MDEVEDPTGLRYYGSDMTIHQTESVNVELDGDGNVVAVWFRCQPLPFTAHETDPRRAESMREMYREGRVPGIEAVVLREQG